MAYVPSGSNVKKVVTGTTASSAKPGSSAKPTSSAKPGSTAWKQEQNAQAAKGSESAGSTVVSGSPSLGGGGSSSSGFTKYTGGNAALDSALKQYGDAYNTARASGDWQGMRNANDAANQLRNQYGYAAEHADDDIRLIASQNGGLSQGGGSSYLSGVSQQQTPQQPAVNDYSAYIEEMNRLAQESALAELRGAYEKNLAGLDRTQQAIAPTYQAARNQAAGQAELQKRQFAEYAAANGLNSGAGGQAQLAMNNALQGSLSNLSTQEASSLADLELQRSQTESDYNSAIAQARANGDYQLANQLYQEKVRADEAMREQMMWQAQQDFQNAQFDWQKQVTQGQMDSDAAQQRFDNLMSLAKYQAEQTGDYSLFAQFGYTAEQIAALEEAWKREHMQLSNGGLSGTRSGGGGSSGTQKPTLTAAQVMSAIESGMVTPGVRSAFEYYYGIPYDEQFKETEGSKPGTQGDTGLATLPGPVNPAWNPQVAANGVMNAAGMVDLLPWTQSGQSLSTAGNTILNQLRTIPGLTEENKVAIIRDALSNGRISEADAQALLTAVGY